MSQSGDESLSTDPYETDGSTTSDESDRDCEPSNRFVYTHDEVNDIIHRMWDTVLDHIRGYQDGLATTTCLVYTIEGINKPGIIKNTSQHAEEILIHQLRNFEEPLKITVYINNSPCFNCANLLKKFLNKNQRFQMVLYITHLYNIKRRSCLLRKTKGKNEDHTETFTDDLHVTTYNGLRDLMMLRGNRCRIDAFTKKVWEDLLNVTGLSSQMLDNYTRRKKGYDRSRQNEDRRIKKDLNGIKRTLNPITYIHVNS